MQKYICILAFLGSVFISNAQIIELTIDHGLTADSVNNIFIINDLPFEFMDLDSLGHHDIILHDSLYPPLQLFSSSDNLEYVVKFQVIDRPCYLFLYYADAGYDYFFLWIENTNESFVSDKFNFEQNEGYDFLFDSINMKNHTILAVRQNSKDQLRIHFK
ncbi:MAG: hypothetical protein IJT51_06055 [Bacteroidales bacterium]|nr:hypothetical protein [Bacteroidales bacterium]